MKKRIWVFLIFYFFLNLAFPVVVYAQATGGYQGVSGTVPPATTPPNQQSSSTLSLTPPDSDLSAGYLSNIFGTVDGVLVGTGSQLLGAMFSIFNGAVLVLGGIVILYTLFVSTINTAHEGEVLGKNWSSVWIPLRSVIGMALLIPKATGYSFIQIFMLWIVIMGVGAADSLWNSALDYFLRGGILMQQNLNLTSGGAGAVGGASTITSSSASLLRSLTCVEMLQQQFTKLRESQLNSGSQVSAIPVVPSFYQDIQASITSQLNSSSATVNLPASNYLATNGVCGTISWSAPSGITGSLSPQSLQQMQQSRGLAVQAMATQLYGDAQRIVANAMVTAGNQFELGHILNSTTSPYLWGAGTPAKPTSPLMPGNVLSNATASYFGIMGPTLNYLQNSTKFANLASSWINDAKAKGWIMAGSYYQQLIALNNSGLSIQETNPPTFNATPIDSTLSKVITGIFPNGSNYVQNTVNLLTGNGSTQVGTSSPFINDAISYANSLSYGNISFAPAGSGGVSSGDKNIDQMMGTVTGLIGPVLDKFTALASAQSNNDNPVVMLASLGALLINVTCGIFVGFAVLIGFLAGVSAFAWGFTFSIAIIGAFMPILGLFTPVLLALLVAGLVMALYIPIIPLIIFTFGAIGWLIAVIEAVIAAPLVALGIAHPEGQPILGKAEPAVGLLVNVFLRPTFMIFGLLIGMMLSYVGIWILNAGFWGAYAQVQKSAISSQTGNIGFVQMFTSLGAVVIYALLVQQIVQKTFTLIYIIPDQVLKWIAINIQGMGGEAEAERAVSGGAHEAAQTGASAVSKGPETASQYKRDKAPDSGPKGGGMEGDSANSSPGGNVTQPPAPSSGSATTGSGTTGTS